MFVSFLDVLRGNVVGEVGLIEGDFEVDAFGDGSVGGNRGGDFFVRVSVFFHDVDDFFFIHDVVSSWDFSSVVVIDLYSIFDA